MKRRSLPPFDIESYVPYLLNRAGSSLVTVFVRGLKPHGLTLSMWRVLAMLYRHGPLRFGALVDLTLLEPPTLSRILSTLEERGLVERGRAGSDGRGVTATLLPQGRELVALLLPHALAVQEHTFAGLTPDEAEFLTRLLKRVCANVAPSSTLGAAPSPDADGAHHN